MASRLSEHFATHPAAGTFFYMSLGIKENPEMVAAFDQVHTVLATQAPASLRWQAQRIAGANHGNNGEWATPAGFRAFYRDWPRDTASAR